MTVPTRRLGTQDGRDRDAGAAWPPTTCWRAIWHLAAKTDARRGEVLGLRRTDVDLQAARLLWRARTVRMSDRNAYAAPLCQILLMTYGPLPALRQALEDMPYLVHASIFGSWARRYAGEPGPPPQDVDVLVVFDASRPEFPEEDTLTIFQAVSRANDRVPAAVFNATLVPVDEWAASSSVFLQQVDDQPRVGVLGDDYGKVL